MPEGAPRLQIIVASTRPGRAGEPVGRWFAERARAHGGFEIDLVDLAELDLPFVDEPNHPALRHYTQQHTKDWSRRVEAADAFVFVTCEYNFGYPAPLKNALDFLFHEWKDKPVGFVSYGGVSAGTRSVQMLRQVASSLKLVSILEAVSIPFVAKLIGEDGSLRADEAMDAAADRMLDELLRVEAALRPLREEEMAAA